MDVPLKWLPLPFVHEGGKLPSGLSYWYGRATRDGSGLLFMYLKIASRFTIIVRLGNLCWKWKMHRPDYSNAHSLEVDAGPVRLEAHYFHSLTHRGTFSMTE